VTIKKMGKWEQQKKILTPDYMAQMFGTPGDPKLCISLDYGCKNCWWRVFSVEDPCISLFPNTQINEHGEGGHGHAVWHGDALVPNM
jgi:hypothetical protein